MGYENKSKEELATELLALGPRFEFLERWYNNTKIDNFAIGTSDRKQTEQEIMDLNAIIELKIKERTAQLEETNIKLLQEIEGRKKIESEISKARTEAEMANKAKSEFLSRLSHKLRTPLNSILGFAQLLDMGQLNIAQKKGAQHILQHGRHLLELINEVLDISRLEAGKLSLSLEPVKLVLAINKILDAVRPMAIERKITLSLYGSPVNQCFIMSDQQRLMQVLTNLVTNAVKFNNIGGSVLVTTELMEKNNEGVVPIRISVEDTGPGISSKDFPKLFRPFERIGEEHSHNGGSGLGLALAKKLMDAMGGQIGVESAVGEGSTFWIELPHCEDPMVTMVKSGILKDLGLQPTNKKGTILYVEDNPSNVELIEQILLNRKHQINLITTAYGMEAATLALQNRPNVVLLDLDLPDIHGSEVVKQLHAEERTREIPIVVISADATPNQIERLLNDGVKYYLTKPFNLSMFLKVIDEFITD